MERLKNPKGRKIDFLVVGAAKAGSTSLNDYLGRHPEIYLPEMKDAWLFIKEGIHEIKNSDIKYFFSDTSSQKMFGYSQVQIMFFEETIPRIVSYNRHIKLIAVLRNPIDRAYSDYWFSRQRAWEDCPTFEEALAREPKRSEGTIHDRAQFTYLAHGHYAEQIERLFDAFGHEQVYVEFTDNLRDDVRGTVSKIYSWLGVDGELPDLDNLAKRNAAALPRWPALQKAVMTPPWPMRVAFNRLVPFRARLAVQKHVLRPLLARNSVPFEYPPMAAETRARLKEHFAPYNERLQKLLDVDLSHWT